MKKKRPVNLDLSSLKFPPMAIISILHRVSGVVLFLLLPLVLCILGQSLQSPELFESTKALLANPYYKVVVWVFCAALAGHVLAGIRHIIMDMGFGEQLNTGRRSAILVMLLTAVLIIVLGIWLW